MNIDCIDEFALYDLRGSDNHTRSCAQSSSVVFVDDGVSLNGFIPAVIIEFMCIHYVRSIDGRS